MPKHITQDTAEESLRAVAAVPRPSKAVSTVSLALAALAWTPLFLSLAWAAYREAPRIGWGIVGLGCTAVLVCVSLALVARQRRVARGWRMAPLLGLGFSGVATSAATILTMQLRPDGWIISLLAVACFVIGFVSGRWLAEAPDDLGLAGQ